MQCSGQSLAICVLVDFLVSTSTWLQLRVPAQNGLKCGVGAFTALKPISAEEWLNLLKRKAFIVKLLTLIIHFSLSDEKLDLNDSKWEDIHVITGALKMFFRELPEPLFTYNHFNDFVNAISKSGKHSGVACISPPQYVQFI